MNIRELGLEIAAHKTEAIWMHGLSKTRRPPLTWLSVQGERIRVKEDLEYLEITLDRPHNFDAHFNRLAPKVERVVALLERLPPNIGGPGSKVSHLYTEVIKSMILCGSPMGTTHHERRSQNSTTNTKKDEYSRYSCLLHCLS